jgi:hypothetical protein
MNFPQLKGATPTLLARRLGLGRGGSGLAEWPVEDASGPRRKPGTAEHLLRRLGALDGLAHQDVPERSFLADRNERQRVALVSPYGDASGFSPLADEGICARPWSCFSRAKAEDGRHEAITSLLLCA